MHNVFEIKGTKYRISAKCHEAIWPRLVDRVQKELIRVGSKSAEEMCGATGTVVMKTNIMRTDVEFALTINPKGLNL